MIVLFIKKRTCDNDDVSILWADNVITDRCDLWIININVKKTAHVPLTERRFIQWRITALMVSHLISWTITNTLVYSWLQICVETITAISPFLKPQKYSAAPLVTLSLCRLPCNKNLISRMSAQFGNMLAAYWTPTLSFWQLSLKWSKSGLPVSS